LQVSVREPRCTILAPISRRTSGRSVAPSNPETNLPGHPQGDRTASCPRTRTPPMSHRYPRIRVTHEDGFMYMREALSLSFYLSAPHQVYASLMMKPLELYAAAAGHALGAYVDYDGWRQALDDAAW